MNKSVSVGSLYKMLETIENSFKFVFFFLLIDTD